MKDRVDSSCCDWLLRVCVFHLHCSSPLYIHVCVRCLRSKPRPLLSLNQSAVPQPTFSMPVTVPVSNQSAAAAAALQFTNNPGGALVTTTSFVTSALTDPRLLSPQQPALQRSTVSPGLPQRPASAGKSRSWATLV